MIARNSPNAVQKVHGKKEEEGGPITALDSLTLKPANAGFFIWKRNPIGDGTGLENRASLYRPWAFDSTPLPP